MKYTAKEFQRYIAEYAAITVDGVLGTFWSTSEKSLTIKVAGENKSIPLSTIQEIPELDSKKKNVEAFIKYLLEQGATEVPKDEWNGLTRSSGPLLIDYGGRRHNFIFMLGHLTEMAGEYYKLAGKKAEIKLFTQLLKKYDLSSDCFQLDEPSISYQETTSKIYRMAPVLAALASKPEETSSTTPTPKPEESSSTAPTQKPQVSPWGETLTSQDDDLLPDMTGFEPDRLGAGEHAWYSTGYLLADRDLVKGEQVRVWLVNEQDGRVIRQVAWKATADKLGKTAWPKAFLDKVNATPVDKDGSKWICAGHLDEKSGNLLVAENGSPTSTAFAALAANQKTELDRLWYYGAGCRLFTNAPFAANRAIAARVPDILPPEGESVVVQVRDRTSLHLYETHLYTPAAGDDSPLGDWSKAMCKAINGHHGMLQAGVLGDDKVTIAPATIANALWVPQYSNLSVELESLSWQKYRAVAAFAPKAGDVVQFLLYDRYSGAQLPGSPFSYTIKPTDTDAAACLASMAKALNKTSLGDYLRLGGAQALDSTPTTAEGWALWFMPLPVRVIVMGVPGLAGSNERALQTPEGQALTLSGLYEAYKEGVTLTLQDRWTGNALESHDFKPTEESKKSSAKWLAALKKQLVSPMTLWGSNTQLGSAKNEAKNEDENTLCLPHEIACVWIARPLNDDVEPANSNSFYINSRLVYKRDYLVWRETKRFAHSHRFPIGSRHEHTFAKILAWNDEVLNERDLVELFHVSDQGPKPQKDVTSEEFQFLAPSANIPALTASALAQNNNYELPLNDTWNLQYPGHYWGRCLSCTESQVIIDFGLLNLEWLRFSDLLKFLMHCRKNKPSIIDILTNAELFKPYTYKNLCQLRSLNILTPDDIELINKMELNPTSRLDKHLLQRVRSAFNINEFAIYPTELFRDFPYFAKYIDDSTRKQLFEEACAIGSEYDLFKSITSIIQKSLEGHTLNDDLKAHLKELGVVSETHALSVLHKATHKEKSNKHYAITLASRAIAKGIRFTTCTSQLPPDAPPFLYNRSSGLGLGIKIYIPSGVTIERDDILCGASHLSKSGIEGDGVFRIDQPFRGKVFKPKDSLCADYAGTLGSEVYDVSGANENGVDPKTGLFHAHYPVGVIRGLEGKGPEVDLTLHYSATRANESALGDGWAFRFSAYDNRLHRLTLSTGQTITLTADHVKKATGKQHLAINGVTLTGCKGKYDALTEITIVFPSGRVEKLAKPGTHDGKEASEHYKKAFVEKVDKLLENLQKWLKETGVTNEQIENINKKIKDLKAMKKDMDRKAFILVPQSITSPQGGTLTFAWEGKEGHIHLQSIKDGDTQLLKGTLDTPVATGKYTSTFTVWPNSVEAYDVTLTIEDCLLTRLTRQGANDPSPVQTVVFGYDGEPVLDRVLCSVAEEDGSLEAVSYAPQWRDWDTSSASPIPLSRVLRHTLQPGAGQESITHIWQWEGINNPAMQEGGTFSSTCSLDTGGAKMGPFTRRTWALKNGFAVPTEVVEEVPGVVRETTTMTYPDSIASEDPTVKFRLATQPIRTTVSTEDLRTPHTPAPTSAAEPSAQESQS
nr:hypothetical protein [uncultured Pseudomonas sp.]